MAAPNRRHPNGGAKTYPTLKTMPLVHIKTFDATSTKLCIELMKKKYKEKPKKTEIEKPKLMK